MGALRDFKRQPINWEFVLVGVVLVWVFLGILLPFASLAWRSALWS
jgi:hypothetical protein